MKITFFITAITLLTFNACVVQRRSSQAEKDFVFCFKSAVLYGALNEYSNGDFQKINRAHNDLGLAPIVAQIFHANTAEAKILGKNFIKSVEPIDYEDYEGRSAYYSESLRYAFGEKVDSIAKAKFREIQRLQRRE